MDRLKVFPLFYNYSYNYIRNRHNGRTSDKKRESFICIHAGDTSQHPVHIHYDLPYANFA